MSRFINTYIIIVLVVLLSAAIVSLIKADMGSISWFSDVQIFEPNQNALIAWNGKKEILILSTDLRASKPTKVLEVMPFPSEPDVRESNLQIFKKATDLINNLQTHHQGGFNLDADSLFASKEIVGGEVTFHELIGSHDISVIRVLNADNFVSWVENYLRDRGVDKPQIPEILKTSVEEYIKDGYIWFVFDVISLGTEVVSKDAIEFQFESDKLYFPLRITRTEEGITTINLIILTNKLLSKFPGIPRDWIVLENRPITLKSEHVKELGDQFHYMFKNSYSKQSPKLRIWKIKGNPKFFNKDLLAY